MKNIAKNIPFLSLLVVIPCLEAMTQVPTELQAEILQSVDVGSFEKSIKKLSELRLVNQKFKNIIDDPYTGKEIIQKIFLRYPETPFYQIKNILLKQNLPSSYAWLKEQAAKNPEFKNQLTNSIRNMLDYHVRYINPGEDKLRELTKEELITIKKLLNVGADPRYESESLGFTLLDIAAIYGDFEAAQLFIDAGANVNHIINSQQGNIHNGLSTLDLALKAENKNPQAKYTQLIELLKSKGAKTSAELKGK